MASAAGLRPNHYELLGVSPSASQQEIAGAFARLMGMFGVRPLATAAQMSVAFEVLRNPAKRRDYDRQLGLSPAPQALPWLVGGVARSSPGVIGSAWSGLGEQVAGRAPALASPEASPRPERHPNTVPATEPKLGSFIAASLRRAPAVDAPVAPAVAAPVAPAPEQRGLDDTAIDWRRPAVAVGALVVAAAIVGAMAGLSVANPDDAAAPPTATIALPPAKTQATAPAAAAPVAAAVAPQSLPIVHAKQQRRVITHPSASFADKEQAPAAALAAASQPAADAPAADAAADPLAPAAAAAAMPLPGKVVARTIQRIGYPCGSVVSTTAGEAAGVYKVTCSSGQTYQATPVNGRYRFRRAH